MAASCAVTGPYQASVVGSGGGFGAGAGVGAHAASSAEKMTKRRGQGDLAQRAPRPGGPPHHLCGIGSSGGRMSRVYAGRFVAQALDVLDVGTGVHHGVAPGTAFAAELP